MNKRHIIFCYIFSSFESLFGEVVCTTKMHHLHLHSVQFSRSVVSDSLWPHEPQHARPPCPSPTPRVRSDSRPSNRWCHPAISSSVVPFSFCPQFLPASGSFPISQLFAWGGKSIGVSASTLVLPMNTQDLSPLEWTGWISLQVQGTLKSLLQHHSSKASILKCSAFFTVQLSHPYMTTGKTIALTRWTFVGKVMSLLFNMLFHCYNSSLNLYFSFSLFKNCISYFWLHWSFVVVCRLSLVAASKGALQLQCMGFSLQWPPCCRLGSRCTGFSSCRTWAQ